MYEFFVSYNQADRGWAEWIAWQLEAEGNHAFLQAWDIRPGANFVSEMQRASQETNRTIAVLSPDYVNAKFTQPEWAAAFAQDPTGQAGVLVPVRVREVELRGLWVAIVFIDLVGLDEETAKQALLTGVRRERAKPSTAPTFPGEKASPPVPAKPTFPATEPIHQDAWTKWSVLDALTTSDGSIAFLFRSESTHLVEVSRAELRTPQRHIIDRLMEEAEGQTKILEIQTVLSELLIPRELRAKLQAASQLCLMVDEQAAQYPWELLFDPRHEPQSQPLAVRTGLVRRLSVKGYRSIQGDRIAGGKVLAVGDPLVTCIPSSTAATREAIAVSSLFERDTPDSARTLTRSMAVDIITALFAESYSVVHIAAQGLYDETNPRRSGLTIGDDLILTANEFDQMQGLPELVFINSGHPPQTSATERVWPPALGRFAAYFASQLVQIGVRAVLISGGAVREDASENFVLSFYRAMLSGESFVTAVRTARSETYGAYPDTNTWGAFHCYGSPEFFLRHPLASDRRLPSDAPSRA